MRLELGQLDLRYADLRIRDVSRERRLTASLIEHGQQTPVLVVRDGDAHVLIDGHVRVAALRKLARDLVDVAVLDVSEAEALVMGHRLDNGRERTALEEGWLLGELCERHDMVQRELAGRLDRSQSWVSRRLGLAKALPESVQNAVRAGKISVQAATKYLVPMARANAEACEHLVQALAGERPSVRQMQRLYIVWKAGDAAERERLVREPWLFLRADAAADEMKDGPEDDEQAAALRDLAIVASVSLRLCRRLAEGDAPVTKRGRAARRKAWARTSRAWLALRTHFEEDETKENTTDARPGHPNGNPSPVDRGARHAHDCPNLEHLERGGSQCSA